MNKLLDWFENFLEDRCLVVRLVILSVIFVGPVVLVIRFLGLNGLVVSIGLVLAALWIDTKDEPFFLTEKKERAKRIFEGQKKTIKTQKAAQRTSQLFGTFLGANRP